MKPSFQKFLNFLNKQELSEELINSLHKLLFCSEKNQKIDINKLKNILNINSDLATRIFKDLVSFNVIKLKDIQCNNCNEKIKKIKNFCPNCDNELEIENYYADIDSLINEENLTLLKNKNLEINNINRISREWNKKGFLSYLLIDLVNSEKIQHEMGDQDFNIFFEKIRKTIKFYTSNNLEGKYIFLGEQGDCFKIAFTNEKDLIKFVINFSKEIIKHVNTDPIVKSYKDRIDFFPKFRGLGDILYLPTSKIGKISAESIISITLDGTVDFNSKSLTSIFRLDHGISTNNENCFKKHDIALWLSEEFIIKNSLNLNTHNLEIGKHEKILRKIGLILLNNGTTDKIEKPINYFK
ncbi:hypothetical protein [Aliarcobacter butzleri]|uniref:hypothetical protein n=1 Tax=Aliarcobacter butzleri TaxID=28197 RepID=UPI0021B3218F|nr:hypothetical protein [Aliarcobacter butzleri]MCT7572294.1 hypothetical protein [Aliarcobacter butzleri]